MPNETIDWEAAMKEIQQDARATARMTQNSMKGLRQVIDNQRRQSQASAKMLTELRQIAENQVDLRSCLTEIPEPVEQARPPYRRFWLLAGFAVGVVCAGFFVSW